LLVFHENIYNSTSIIGKKLKLQTKENLQMESIFENKTFSKHFFNNVLQDVSYNYLGNIFLLVTFQHIFKFLNQPCSISER